MILVLNSGTSHLSEPKVCSHVGGCHFLGNHSDKKTELAINDPVTRCFQIVWKQVAKQVSLQRSQEADLSNSLCLLGGGDGMETTGSTCAT